MPSKTKQNIDLVIYPNFKKPFCLMVIFWGPYTKDWNKIKINKFVKNVCFYPTDNDVDFWRWRKNELVYLPIYKGSDSKHIFDLHAVAVWFTSVLCQNWLVLFFKHLFTINA